MNSFRNRLSEAWRILIFGSNSTHVCQINQTINLRNRINDSHILADLAEHSEEVIYPPIMAGAPVLDIDQLKIGYFPQISSAKIHHRDYISLKEKYLLEAFKACNDYYLYLIYLPPISRQREYSNAIAKTIRAFINIFWDMPSSKNHHDAKPFGQLQHSLLVACHEARRFAQHNVLGPNGIDSERTRKERPKLTLAGFLCGLLHDANKILNYHLEIVTENGPLIYSPFHGSGSILEFLLKNKHRGPVIVKWKENEYQNLNYGIHLFYEIVPRELKKYLLGEFEELIQTTILFFRNSSDHVATSQALKQQNYLEKIVACSKEIALQSNSINHPGGWAFKLCSSWYLVLYNEFFKALSVRMEAKRESLQQVLIDNSLIFCFGSGTNVTCSFQLELYLANSRRAEQFVVSFVNAAFFDQILTDCGHSSPIPNYSIKIHEKYMEYLATCGLAVPKHVYKALKRDVGSAPTCESDVESQILSEDSPVADLSEKQSAPAPPKRPLKSEAGISGTKPISPLSSIEGKISHEFSAQIHNIPNVLMTSLCNAWGVNDTKVINSFHLQRLGDERTVFYILRTRALWARSPHVLKLAWELFLAEKSKGFHPWAESIPDLPLSFTATDLISSAILRFIYLTWGNLGLLLPRDNKAVFLESNQPVTLITGYRKSEPQRLEAIIKGNFIELNPEAMLKMQTQRLAKGSMDDALYSTFYAAYGQRWSCQGEPNEDIS